MDIVRNDNNELELVNREAMGQCNRECETVRSVCESITATMGEDIAEWMYENVDKVDDKSLLEFMCSDVCVQDGMRPKVPKKLVRKSKIGDEEWIAMSEEEKRKRVQIFKDIVQQNTETKSEL